MAFNANNLLGALLQSGLTGSSHKRMDRGFGDAGGKTGSGGLGHLLGGGAAGGLAGAALSLLGGRAGAGRSIGRGSGRGGGGMGGMARGGGMAVVAGIAAAAFNQYTKSRGSAAAPAAPPPSPPHGPAVYRHGPYAPPPPPAGREASQGAGSADDAASEAAARVVLLAMINAAKADGAVDAAEMRRIMDGLDAAGADDEERRFVMEEMAKPLDLDALVSLVDGPDRAVEAYAASLLAIEVDTDAERDYLRRLAHGLRLDPAMVRALHDRVGAPQA